MLHRAFLSLAVVLLLLMSAPRAQHRLVPVASLRGEPALELMLRKLDTVGNFMMTTAHPDDENNAMLAYFAHGKGYRTSLVTATHGEGGQNEIGPELFEALAVLRTEELLAAHRYDGARAVFPARDRFRLFLQRRGNAREVGSSGDPRRLRPHDPHASARRRGRLDFRRRRRWSASPGLRPVDARGVSRRRRCRRHFPSNCEGRSSSVAGEEVLLHRGLGFGGPGGGGAARRGGPPRVPEFTGTGAARALTFTGGGDYDADAWADLRRDRGRSALDAQVPGHVAAAAAAQSCRRAFTGCATPCLPDGLNRSEEGDVRGNRHAARRPLDVRRQRILRHNSSNALERIAIAAADARKGMQSAGSAATVPALARGLAAVRELRAALASMGLDETARFEIDFRLKPKEEQFSQALILAADLRLESLANDGLLVGGQPVQVRAIASRRGSVPVTAQRV